MNKRQSELNHSVDVLIEMKLLRRQRRIARAGMVISLVLLGLLYGFCLGGQV